jgi:hypothetical protein
MARFLRKKKHLARLRIQRDPLVEGKLAGVDGSIMTGSRKVTGWSPLVNLQAAPCEHMPFGSAM